MSPCFCCCTCLSVCLLQSLLCLLLLVSCVLLFVSFCLLYCVCLFVLLCLSVSFYTLVTATAHQVCVCDRILIWGVGLFYCAYRSSYMHKLDYYILARFVLYPYFRLSPSTVRDGAGAGQGRHTEYVREVGVGPYKHFITLLTTLLWLLLGLALLCMHGRGVLSERVILSSCQIFSPSNLKGLSFGV